MRRLNQSVLKRKEVEKMKIFSSFIFVTYWTVTGQYIMIIVVH